MHYVVVIRNRQSTQTWATYTWQVNGPFVYEVDAVRFATAAVQGQTVTQEPILILSTKVLFEIAGRDPSTDHHVAFARDILSQIPGFDVPLPYDPPAASVAHGVLGLARETG